MSTACGANHGHRASPSARFSAAARSRTARLAVGGCVLAVTAAVTAGCTTVPIRSRAEVIQPIDTGAAKVPHVPGPPRGADQRQIITGFLDASGASDPHHNGARAYLTPAAQHTWSDATVTIIDSPRVGLARRGGRITVSGIEEGTLDKSGVYTPVLRGNGTGFDGLRVSEQFRLTRVHGQWRINSLPKTLLISDQQFQSYQQRVVYFFDAAQQHLVPEPRYTQLNDPESLAQWLIAGVADGPEDANQGSEQTELPQQTDPSRVKVEVRGPKDPTTGESITTIEIPGAGQLARGTRDRLAAQIAQTLHQVSEIDEMTITDGGVPVRISRVGQTTFRYSDVVTSGYAPPRLGAEMYYVRDGGVVDAQGQPLPGRVGNGAYDLESVALRTNGGDQLLVAGVRPSGDASVLDVGSVAHGLVATKVRGQLSRPEWAPDRAEIWIGNGPVLYRVTPRGKAQAVPVNAASGKATGRVTAVRISPEGARIALVLTNPHGLAQIWVGAIVRASGKVRVDGLTPISPQDVTVTDVAWNDQLKLFTIGFDQDLHTASVWEVDCDGSRWQDERIMGLPRGPDSITVLADSPAAVSVGSTVWKQNGDVWESLRGDETPGRNPIYVE